MDTSCRERPGDVLTAREQLVEAISSQIGRQGYYLSNIDPAPHQALVDVRWAAQVAGRQLGKPMRTYTSAVGKRSPGKITVIIAPLEAGSVAEVEFCNRLREAITQMQDRNVAVLAGPMPA
jgi:hypothetical protein